MAEAASPPGRLVYHLTRRTWEARWFGAHSPTTWSAPPAISRQTLQAVSIRGGRSSHEEKTAWSNSMRLLLRTEPWSISRATEFAEVEQLVVVLSKFVEFHWGDTIPDDLAGWSWCVGASLKATFESQNARGDSNELHLALCPKAEWTGNGRGKVGNTCRGCCDGVPTSTVSIAGSSNHSGAVAKKCVWLKCCYGRRAFGGTDALSWSPRCEQQKKLQGDALKTSVQPAQGGPIQQHAEEPAAKKRKVIAPVPTWPSEAAHSRHLSPSISPLVTPRGRLSDESPRASDGLAGLSSLPSPIPAITPRGRAAAHIVANMRNTNARPNSTSLAT